MANRRNSSQKNELKQQLFGDATIKKCCFCRVRMTFRLATLEHVVPLAHGGGWELSNLRLSCESCNNERGTQDFDTFQKYKRGK